MVIIDATFDTILENRHVRTKGIAYENVFGKITFRKGYGT